MTKVIIKHRLFTWFEETASLVKQGETVLTERINHMGDEVDITNPDYYERGKLLGSFYTDAEADKIREGTYRGRDAAILARFRAGQFQAPQAAALAVEGEHGDVEQMDAMQLSEYIRQNELTPEDVIALAGDTEESINKVLEAESYATDYEPREEVVAGLEAKLTEVRDGGNGVEWASDAAKKHAADNNVDPSTITATGSGGKITKGDVDAAIKAREGSD